MRQDGPAIRVGDAGVQVAGRYPRWDVRDKTGKSAGGRVVPLRRETERQSRAAAAVHPATSHDRRPHARPAPGASVSLDEVGVGGTDIIRRSRPLHA